MHTIPEGIMNRAAAAFLAITVMTGLLAALSFALELKGYPVGALGIARLDGIASAATFLPLSALYALSGVLMIVLPVRAAGIVYANAATPTWHTGLVLLATILGVQIARFAFGNQAALNVLLDWRFIFAIGLFGIHFVVDRFRRNVLLRTLGFVLFTAIMLACLYWTFRL